MHSIFSFIAGLMTCINMLDFIFFKNLKGLSHKLSHLSFANIIRRDLCQSPFQMGKLKHREVPLLLAVFQSLAELRID